MYTTKDVAKKTGLSLRRIQQACEKYNLGSRFGGARVLTDDDISIIIDHKRKKK